MATKFKFFNRACDGESTQYVKAADFDHYMESWAHNSERAYGGFVTMYGNVITPGNEATEAAIKKWFNPAPEKDPKEEMSLNDLYDYHEHAIESLGEVEAQAASETALYGDSWPGSRAEIESARKQVAEIAKTIEAREEQASRDWGNQAEYEIGA